MKLPQEQIAALLGELPGWSHENDAVTRQFTFTSFPDAIAFATRLAFDAEAHDHHPDLHISYRRVRVTWTTHSEGGVTEKDTGGARRTEVLAQAFGGRPSA